MITVPGSRGDAANALKLDIAVDDRLTNCVDIIAASRAKAVLLLRRDDPTVRDQALARGIAVVNTLAAALDAIEVFEERKAVVIRPSLPPCGLVQAVKARGRGVSHSMRELARQRQTAADEQSVEPVDDRVSYTRRDWQYFVGNIRWEGHEHARPWCNVGAPRTAPGRAIPRTAAASRPHNRRLPS